MSMDIEVAIRTRRTIFHFKPDPVPTQVLLEALEAGIWAPNHHLSEPWRFTIVGEKTKQQLAERYADLQSAKLPASMSPEQLAERRAGFVRKFMSKPTVVCVSCLQEGDEVRRREDYAAVCCAVQNIQLQAWSKGLGMQWTTSPVTTDAAGYELLGVDPAAEYIAGFLYVGYPAEIPSPKRKPLAEVLRWTE